MKKLAVTLIAILLLCTCGCVNPFLYGRYPSDQPGTTWATQDNKVSFSIPEDKTNPILGHIRTVETDVQVQFHMSVITPTVYITYQVYGEGDVVIPDETWHPTCTRKNKFVVEIEESNYFEKGEKLVFYKTDKKS